MHPIFLIFLVLVLPFLTAFLVIAPIHFTLYAACYLVYKKGNHEGPILDHVYDPFFILESYQRLIEYWLANHAGLSFIGYTLPLIIMPTIITLLTLWLVAKFLLIIKHRLENANSLDT